MKPYTLKVKHLLVLAALILTPRATNLSAAEAVLSSKDILSSDVVIKPRADKACRVNLEIKKRVKNAVKDYNMCSSLTEDQSDKLQNAIDDMALHGGGKLILPKGNYCFSNVYMNTGVHLFIEKGACLKPFIKKSGKNIIMLNFSPKKESENFISNCSVQGLDGRYTVDYSDVKDYKQSVRFICCRLVKNFQISDVDIIDNFTTHCGIIFVPAKTIGADKWEVSRPTDGLIKNCSINHASMGYGLCQLHGAQSLKFINLFADGGITLRLESGAGGIYAGVFGITAKNITNQNGLSAIMMNPHATQNGTVVIDSVWTKSSSFAVLIRQGFIDRKHKNDPSARIGSYANDCKISHIHAIYGINAQIDRKDIWVLDPSLYKELKGYSVFSDKTIIGPSLATVLDDTNNNYKVTCTDITSEGFTYYSNRVLFSKELNKRKKQTWQILKQLNIK